MALEIVKGIENMDSNNFETVYIKEELSRCEDVDELKSRILPMIESQQKQWAKKINEIINESGFTKEKIAEMCSVSRTTVYKWCKGSIPRNRETFLRIGMAVGYGREQMNRLLQRYGGFPELYAKSLEDCVCIFVLDKGYREETLAKYDYILEKIKENIIKSDNETGVTSTVSFDKQLSNIKDEDELETFIMDNTATFVTAYHNFYAYVKIHILANSEEIGVSVHELAEGQGWSSSLRQTVSKIRQSKWYPTRNKIISLGLHLNMDHEQIDEMLDLAHMEPLCAKNAFESIIMFILDNASLNNMLDAESVEYDVDELCRYARDVLKEFDMPEVDSFIAELSEMDDDTW